MLPRACLEPGLQLNIYPIDFVKSVSVPLEMNSHLLIPKYPLPLGICSEKRVLEELK